MQNFIKPELTASFDSNQLLNLDYWKSMGAVAVDKGNQRQGGWSQVFRIELEPEKHIYLKHQQNYLTRSLHAPIAGEPTVSREYRSIKKFSARNIPTADVLAFASGEHRGQPTNILITKGLDGYNALDIEWVKHNATEKDALLRATASLIRHLHQNNIEYRSLYPKHIMARQSDAHWDLAFIDLESARFWPMASPLLRRDIRVLLRRSRHIWSEYEQILFCEYYTGNRRAGNKLWEKTKNT